MKNRFKQRGCQEVRQGERTGGTARLKLCQEAWATGKMGRIFKFYKENPSSDNQTGLIMIRPCPTLPHALACSTIGAESLNFRVRNGNGCDPFAIKTGILNQISVENILTIEFV